MPGNSRYLKPLLIVLALSIVLRAFLLHPTFSDESFYFNAAKSVAGGKIPYVDFFFAHPPLQLYSLAFVYEILGSSFFTGKFLTLLYSSTSAALIYFITKNICEEKYAFLTSVLFLVIPPFVAFSHISSGMWEPMALLLLSTLLIFRKRPFLSAVAFSVAVLFRYIAVLYLPLLLVILHLRNERIRGFLLVVAGLLAVSIATAWLAFGQNYIEQTLFYHLSKVSTDYQTQYLSMGMFPAFLAAASALIGFFRKDKLMMAFSLMPLAADALLLVLLKTAFYHYFLLSVPFYLIAFSRVLRLEYKFLKLSAVAFLAISLATNFNTLDFYLNPAHAEKFYYIADFTRANTAENDTIFGEPVAANYASLVTGRGIAGDYLDSYMQHLAFEGNDASIRVLGESRPKLFIDMNGYFTSVSQFENFVSGNYVPAAEIEGAPSYLIYRIKP
jgi:hypothetical protein